MTSCNVSIDPNEDTFAGRCQKTLLSEKIWSRQTRKQVDFPGNGNSDAINASPNEGGFRDSYDPASKQMRIQSAWYAHAGRKNVPLPFGVTFSPRETLHLVDGGSRAKSARAFRNLMFLFSLSAQSLGGYGPHYESRFAYGSCHVLESASIDRFDARKRAPVNGRACGKWRNPFRVVENQSLKPKVARSRNLGFEAESWDLG